MLFQFNIDYSLKTCLHVFKKNTDCSRLEIIPTKLLVSYYEKSLFLISLLYEIEMFYMRTPRTVFYIMNM